MPSPLLPRFPLCLVPMYQPASDDDVSATSAVRCPWWGWEAYAGVSAAIYASAAWSMHDLHNDYASAGWAVTAVLCFLWFLFFRNERRAQPLRCPLRFEGYTAARKEFQLPAAALVPSSSFVPPPSPEPEPAFARRLPFYCTAAAIAVIGCIAVLLLTLDAAFLGISISTHAPLTGSSTWMAFISFCMSIKCCLQLIASLWRGRQRWLLSIAQAVRDSHGLQAMVV